MGEVVTLSTSGINLGEETVTIKKIRSSCGCTSAVASQLSVAKGASTNITIEVDTQQKLGQLRKLIRVYHSGSRRPNLIHVTGEVLPHQQSHLEMSTMKGSLFGPKCASCHLSPGKGLHGQELYLALCASCHGSFRDGHPSLLYPQKHWGEVIRNGRGRMEGFAQHLTEKQIESLERYLNSPLHLTTQNATPTRSLSGRAIYAQWCSSCHGKNRMGPIGPDIRAHTLLDFTKAEIFALIKNGGDSKLMPAFKRVLNDEEIQKLVTFLKP